MLINNIQNGGLICEVAEKIIIADIKKGIGIHLIHGTNKEKLNPIMPWFMSADQENNLYYSDAAKGGYLCKMSLSDKVQTTLVSQPVYLLQKYKNTLYYINEKTRHLYSYSLRENQAYKLISEEIIVFTISKEHIWYVSDTGIYVVNLEGKNKDRVSNNSPMRLIYSNNKLIFIDKQLDYAISYMDIDRGKIKTIADSMANNINIYHNFIFYNQAKDQSHLYRYSIENEFNIKFAPERADYIHIINDTIYYLNQDNKVWMKVPVQGGKFQKLIE